jgi:hypothetical protein
VFNLLNLAVYHYAGNNPVKYTDPDGKLQTWYQAALTAAASFASKNLGLGEIMRSATEVVATRNVYEGISVNGDIFYKDNISVSVFGVALNNIQAQTTVDYTSKYPASEATPDNIRTIALIGVDAPTNKYAKDTILFDKAKANYFHRAPRDFGKPYSGGCAIPAQASDKEEVMRILRDDLGLSNGGQVPWVFTSPSSKPPKENIEGQ